MRITNEDLTRIVKEELSAVQMENLIKEITKRKFCQLMGLAGGALASGCGLDYELLNTKDNNEAGKPPPSCIQDPDIQPNLSDIAAWTGTPIKLYDFIAQPAFGKDDIYVSDNGDEVEVMIMNVPATADIWNIQFAAENPTPMYDDDDIIRIYEHDGVVSHLVMVKIRFPIYTGEDGEEYVRHPSDGGGGGASPQKNTEGCGLEYEEWLNPNKSLEEVKQRGKKKMKLTKETLKRIIKEELEAFVNEVEEEAHEEEQDLEEANSVNRTQRDAEKMAAFLDVPEEEREAQALRQQPKNDIETKRAGDQRAAYAAQEKGRKPLPTNMGPTDVTKNLKAYDKRHPWYRR